MLAETTFSVKCGDSEHTIIIGTKMIPDPDAPKIITPRDSKPEPALVVASLVAPPMGLTIAKELPCRHKASPHDHWQADEEPNETLKTIPAPWLEFVSHCTCGKPYPFSRVCTSATCDGQQWLKGKLVWIKVTEHTEPSCAQFFLEFMGQAPKRIEQAWWKLVSQPATPKKAATRGRK